MPPSSKQVEIDARWVYWRSFLLFFLVNQLRIWHRISRVPFRVPGHRVLVFLLKTPRSFAVSLLAAGVFTLLAILVVGLIVRPLLRFWLNPAVDASWGLFHLSASETIIASMPARRRSGWRWQPGLLAVTNRRLWFFSAAWDDEPWSLGHEEVDQIELEHSTVAGIAPVRNWPVPVHLWGRSGQDAVFAVADRDAVLAWFRPIAGEDGRSLNTAGGRPQAGVLDA